MIRKNETSSPSRSSLSQKKRLQPPVLIAGAVVLVLIIAGAFSSTALRSRKSSGGQLGVSSLVEKVGRHIRVIQGEQPTVATVQDPEELKRVNPAFYSEAKAGDRLLIWSDKAVLYSETEDIVLAVLPISIFTQQPVQPTEPANVVADTSSSTTEPVIPVVETASIEVRNGTFTVGLAGNLANKLQEEGGFETLKPKDAARKDYEKTIIVKLSDQPLTETLKKLVEITKAEVVELPSAETNVKGDILIIVGADYQP
jgi:CTP:molybdopterin cytidylyltransferase MocA